MGSLRYLKCASLCAPNALRMHLDWEAVAGIASVLSSVAVLAAIVVGIRQVRVGASQVEHLRRATQLEGTMKIFEMLGSAEQFDARRFIVQGELATALADPGYRAELPLMSFAQRPHPELTILRLMEMIGVYVKHGLLDEGILFDFWSPPIVVVWPMLVKLGVIPAHRAAVGPLIWENAEYLYDRAAAYEAGRGAPTLAPDIGTPP